LSNDFWYTKASSWRKVRGSDFSPSTFSETFPESPFSLLTTLSLDCAQLKAPFRVLCKSSAERGKLKAFSTTFHSLLEAISLQLSASISIAKLFYDKTILSQSKKGTKKKNLIIEK